MIYTNYIRLTFLIAVLFYSCSKKTDNKTIQKNPFEQYLTEFLNTFPVLSQYDWKVNSGDFNDDKTEVTLELEAKRGDTTIVLSLEKYLVMENNMLSNCYTIARFIKKYQENGLIHEMYTVGGDNTMFHYYYSEELPRKRYIVEGRNRYMEYFGVDSTQIFFPLDIE